MLPGDYELYKVFLEEVTSDNTELLSCLRVLPYKISFPELKPEIINQITNYLSDKRCPTKLYYKIVKNTSNTILNELKKSPYSCGFDDNEMKYESNKLQNLTISHLKNYCNRLLDNIELNNILPASLVKTMDEIDGNFPTDELPKHIVCATKNSRRYMEDRHCCMEQLNTIYDVHTTTKASLYAVFDGHAGHVAATYSASHFPYNLVTSENYPSHPIVAMKDAFLKTDNDFIEKDIDGGSTAVCALYLPGEKSLIIGWVGDSQALVAREGLIYQVVKPHRPIVASERDRIEQSGGAIMQWGGELRVNGMLNITRAIGDRSCKPYITSEPDLVKLNMNNREDFLVLGCDGLWDHVENKAIAEAIYKLLEQDCDNLDRITKYLIDLAKKGQSRDNITIIIVFFKHPSKIQRPTEIMESPTFDSFDVAAVKIEATEECSNNANKTDFDNLCWIKKENQDQVDDVLVKSEQKYQYNDDLNNILENSTLIKTHGDDENNYNHEHQESVNQDLEHLNLNNQNNLMPFIKSEFNGAENNVHEQFNDHEIKLEEKIENNHDSSDLHHHDNHHHEDDGHEHEAETENRNNLVAFDDFGPETSVDEIVPEEKLNDDNEENEIENEELVPMETTISSSPSIEVTTNTLDELNFQEKAEEVIITPSSDLDDDSVDKQLSSVDNTNTISEVEEEVEPEDLLKSPVTEPAIDENIIMGQEEEILKSPDAEPIVDQNIIVEEQNALIANSEHNLDLQIGNEEGGAAAHIDENTNIFSNEEQHVESTMNDSTNIVSAESVPQQQIHDSCEESDEEWNYMKTKEGQTEKENKNNASFTEDFKENIEPEPATEKEISSVELKEQLDLTPDLESPAAVDTATSIENTSAPAFDIEPLSPEPVSFESDKLQKTPENMMTDENNFHLNPEAKEFVPTTYTSPTSNNEQLNGGGDFGEINDLHRKQPYRHVFDDVVSQSPKKGRESNMDDLQLPAENDFDDEIANRPHELLDDDVQMPEESVKPIEEPTIEPQKENELLIQNALDNVGMKDSLYIENTSSGFNNGEVDLLNSIQPLPDIELEENNILSNKEGLSLEIDEKDVISPSSEDAKEIVTEIEEKLNDMLIQETSTVEDHVQQQQDVMEEPHEPAKELEVVEPANEPEVTELYKEPEVMEQIKEPEVIEPTKEPEVAEPAKEQEVIELTKEPEVIEITKEPEVIETTKEPEVIESTKEPEVIEPVDQQNESVVVPEAESFVQQPEPFVAEVTPQVEEKLEESLVTNGDINVEELNKKNLEESAKLAEEQTAKIDDSKLLEATLGAVAVTAAVAATAKAASAKKSPASKTTTASSAKKPAVATTAARKLGTTTTSTAARPKTAPVKTIADRKPASTTKTTSVTSATKPRVEVKKTTTTTLSKPKEVTKTTEIKKTTSTRPMVPKAATTTAPKPRPASASVTNGISKTTTLKSTTTSSLKPTSTTAAPKPRLSPRSTVSSTLRKTETMKSPTAKSTSTTSRVDTGLKNVSAPKSASSATKPATTLRSKPATTTTSTTMKSTLKTTTTTTTSQRKTASPMDKKKLLAPTLTGPSSARKSLSKTPTKPSVAKKAETPAAKVETAAAPAPEIEEIKSEVEQASPAAVEMPIA